MAAISEAMRGIEGLPGSAHAKASSPENWRNTTWVPHHCPTAQVAMRDLLETDDRKGIFP
ncbi:MAG: hypothetical protein IPL86_00020 [Flavobacteriales bacterium]|nr:hypothetical protein [Flavobacteriales bacterium]